jgi:hypothetical protein
MHRHGGTAAGWGAAHGGAGRGLCVGCGLLAGAGAVIYRLTMIGWAAALGLRRRAGVLGSGVGSAGRRAAMRGRGTMAAPMMVIRWLGERGAGDQKPHNRSGNEQFGHAPSFQNP